MSLAKAKSTGQAAVPIARLAIVDERAENGVREFNTTFSHAARIICAPERILSIDGVDFSGCSREWSKRTWIVGWE